MRELENLLKNYRSAHPEEAALADDFLQFYFTDKNSAFSRDNARAHFTASAWILGPDMKSALLTHHRKLNKWIQLGGHFENDLDPLAAALREAKEESGINELTPLTNSLFDIDKHLIPARKNESEHYHYDLRFLFRSNTLDFKVSAESKDLAWVKNIDLLRDDSELSLKRMCAKSTQNRLT